MKHLFCISLILYSICFSGYAQRYFKVESEIPLHTDGTISLNPDNPINVVIDQSSEIFLSPPDMARIDRRRIIDYYSDTLLHPGRKKIMMNLTLDTLFVTKDIYLTDARIKSEVYEDQTFDRKASFGIQALRQIGQVSGPVQTGGGDQAIKIQGLAPRSLGYDDRLSFFMGNSGALPASLPFHQQSLQTIHLVIGNNLDETFLVMEELDYLFRNTNLYCQNVSIDTNIPPLSALSRLPGKITVRYFEKKYQPHATALAELVSELFDLPIGTVVTEDMLPYYGGNTPIFDYIEIWIN